MAGQTDGGRWKPWRAIPLGRLLHRPGEELRVELFWLTEAEPVRLELRQWDMRSEAPIPTPASLLTMNLET